MRRRSPNLEVLRIDPTMCAGVAMCARVAPNTISVDPWGFAIIPTDVLTESQAKEAHKAVRACPKNALFVETREFEG